MMQYRPELTGKQVYLRNMIRNPEAVHAAMVNDVVNKIEENTVAHEYRKKYPDLRDYEPLIEDYVKQEIKKAARNGTVLSNRDAVEAGIASFLEQFPLLRSGNTNAKNQDLKGTIPGQGIATEGKTVWKMSPAEFDAYDDQVMRDLNYYH